VPNDFPSGGKLSPSDILVSNFNDPPNTQGTGTTSIKVAPDGETSTFFQGTFSYPSDGGLTTALGVLKRGFVVVGQLPNNGGTPEPGSILFLDKNGTPVLKYTNVTGPWDLAIDDDFDHARIFVSNVLSGTGVRLDVSVGSSTLTVTNVTEVAHGYAFGLNMAAFVVGPTGLAYDAEADVLYVASTSDNEIFKILHAETTNTSVLKGILVYNLWNRQGLASEGP
jgi:DNA-binding beta-propeller fold protein YncE